jgi:alpha-tubulin suppressor-like RCC1 family protein
MQSGVASVAAGCDTSCFLKTNGEVWCAGYNTYGQLGDGSNSERHVPTKVYGLDPNDPVVSISVSPYVYGRDCVDHTVALTAGGNVYSWGYNGYGQLGLGTTVDHNSAQLMTLIPQGGVNDVRAGNLSTIVIRAGVTYSFGYNDYGKLGNGQSSSYFTSLQEVAGFSNVATAVEAGGYTSYGILNGKLFSWGYGGYGEIGNGQTTASNSAPIAVPGFDSNTVEVGGGGFQFSCAIKQNTTSNANELYCWGYNGNGQLGVGSSSTYIAAPQRVNIN